MKRCRWVNLNNVLYVKYHDEEWGIEEHCDKKLFEFLVLEIFQAGLSWECILNKRENFKMVFDDFDPEMIAKYDDNKIKKLLDDPCIIRNKKKIESTINNAKIFLEIQKEYGTFDKYIWSFTGGRGIKNTTDIFTSTSELSDKVSSDMRKRGMKFIGSTIVYSYLQAIGVINDHELGCFRTNK